MNSDQVEQPNLESTAAEGPWSGRFLLVVVLIGAATGIAGGLLMGLLRGVEHVAWGFSSGTFLQGTTRAAASRHVVILAAAGILVGVGGIVMRRTLGKTEDAESAIWLHWGRVPLVATLVRAVYAIVTVGMGTSLGRESPIKQAGGAIASCLGQWGKFSPTERRLLAACGVGAGMGAAYNVPVGGALFAIEVLMGEISLRMAMPALLCSGVATVASWALLPTGPIYNVPEYPVSVQLTVWAILAGPLLGLATVPVVRMVGWAYRKKPKRDGEAVVLPIVVLTLLGIISIVYPQLLGNGQDSVQLAFTDQFAVSLLLILPVLKLLATGGCLRAGASGGLFTPTMTIGALLGGFLGHVWDHVWQGASMGSCAVIGACAFLAAASQGPVSALVMVLELTRHVDTTMAPMLLAVTGAMLAARKFDARSIYSIRLERL